MSVIGIKINHETNEVTELVTEEPVKDYLEEAVKLVFGPMLMEMVGPLELQKNKENKPNA